MSIVNGTANSDYINGSDGNDYIYGLAGSDTLFGEGGTDRVYGGDGDDWLHGGGVTSSGLIVIDGSGYPVDQVVDYLYGEGGDDWILAGLGDEANGGLGYDSLGAYFVTSTVGVSVDFSSVWTGGSFSFGISGSNMEALGFAYGSNYNDTLITGSVAGSSSELYGLDGEDILVGGAGNDLLDANVTFVMDTDADELYGLGGDDILRGGLGDYLDGGSGIDSLWLDLGSASEGADCDFSLMLDGSAATIFGATLVGFEHISRVSGTAYGDVLDASADFYDTELFGKGGDDLLIGNAWANVLSGGDGIDTLQAGAGDDELDGDAGDDTLYGGDGNDEISGGTGIDTLTGGAGNDSYVVDSAADVVVEAVAGGTDKITSSVTLTLVAEVENLVLTGSAAINGTGNGLANSLIGNQRANVLNGGTGADTLSGLGGDDQYYVDNAADVVIEVASGGLNDRIFASVSYTQGAGVQAERLTTDNSAGTSTINLTGNELANLIYGNAGNNVLDGKGGADALIGFGGDDSYYVDSALDTVTEGAGEGTADRIFASVSYTQGAGVEVEQLATTDDVGTATINLTGNELVNAIKGNAGANTLDGKGGADTLTGLGGDDWYIVDNVADVIVEGSGGGTNDRIFASINYAQAAGVQVERLTTDNNAGTNAINLTGNELANLIYGNAGNNVLDGKGGADALIGFGGDDSYYVDSALDTVTEGAGEGTADRIFASVSYTQGAGVEVERLTTDNNAGTSGINLTGNALANLIYGNAGANVLDGKEGADGLVGLGGTDSFAFTTALGAGNIDTVDGFSVADDTIWLDDAVFTGLATGALAAGAFNTASAATQADDRIVYDSASGALFFDADGVGGAAAVQFATLAGGLALTSVDFLVI